MSMVIVIISFLWLNFASAAPVDDAAKLADQLTAINTLTANFRQVKSSKATNKTIISGQVTLARPGELRWEITDPDPTLLIVTKDGIVLYEPELNQAIIKRNELTMENPAMLLSCSTKELIKFFTVKQLSLGRFKLTPKKTEAALYEAVELQFKDHKLTTMIVTNLLGQEEKLYFSEVKLNPKLDLAVFSFKAGPKVEVVDERKLKGK